MGSNESNVGQFNDTFQRFATIDDASEFVKSKCEGWKQTAPEILGVYDESYIFNRSTGRDSLVSFYCRNNVNANNTSVGYSYFQLEDIVIYSVTMPAYERPTEYNPSE